MNCSKKHWNLGLALLVIAILATSAAFAQEITGTIVGTVTDTSGSVIANATVTVTNTDKNLVVRTLTTSQNGEYVATLLPIGHYTVEVVATGFRKTARTQIELNVNDRLAQNFPSRSGRPRKL